MTTMLAYNPGSNNHKTANIRTHDPSPVLLRPVPYKRHSNVLAIFQLVAANPRCVADILQPKDREAQWDA